MWDFYKNNYKKMMIAPSILAIILLVLIIVYPGIQPGVDLTGGNEVILRSPNPISETQLISVLKENFNLQELKVSTIASPTSYGARIQYSKDPFTTNINQLLSKAETAIDANADTPETVAVNETTSIGYSQQVLTLLKQPDQNFSNAKTALLAAQKALASYKEDFSQNLQETIVVKLGLGNNAEFQKREIEPSLGAKFFESTIIISIIGMILICLVIFIAFRQLIPSAAIIQAMIFDVIAALAGMALLHIPLSLTTLPALLMLIGYSVDTDIMLTSRMLKIRDGTPGEHATASMITGLTMTGTAIAALISMIFVSYFYQIEVIYQIAVILFFGLLGDMISTWFMNAPILLWWVEKREKKRNF